MRRRPGYLAAAVAANSPRPTLRNRDSRPFLLISRMIAACSVAAGVLPPDFHKPDSRARLVTSPHCIGSPASTSTLAAASSPLIRFTFGGFVTFALAEAFGLGFVDVP